MLFSYDVCCKGFKPRVENAIYQIWTIEKTKTRTFASELKLLDKVIMTEYNFELAPTSKFSILKSCSWFLTWRPTNNYRMHQTQKGRTTCISGRMNVNVPWFQCRRYGGLGEPRLLTHVCAPPNRISLGSHKFVALGRTFGSILTKNMLKTKRKS